ncbi:NAD(P)H-dependent oxidoreductase [Streptomyces sp. P38-E01]|uniref:NAD(P)H-dependent oxidoreductase n=1 Tax=Streptomyces tardus TaxID=2780544 RepID=A0A949N1J4_9ACTN|nr:NAD(P)H-dependent oxidoreductase [Streptomyces tardus]MBU7597890.1 NAD(P)H-dependent oxidoreductase [Streptomyces tardus]
MSTPAFESPATTPTEYRATGEWSEAARRSYLFVLGSSRTGGNTEVLARAAADQLPPQISQRWVDLKHVRLPDFRDGVHQGHQGYEEGVFPGGEAERQLYEATVSATDIVFAAPMYWYGMPAQLKRYFDYWSGWLNAPSLEFQQRMAGRRLWNIAARADPRDEMAEGLIAQLTNAAAFMGMSYGGALLGRGVARRDIYRDQAALARAKTFFRQDVPLARFTCDVPVEQQ